MWRVIIRVSSFLDSSDTEKALSTLRWTDGPDMLHTGLSTAFFGGNEDSLGVTVIKRTLPGYLPFSSVLLYDGVVPVVLPLGYSGLLKVEATKHPSPNGANLFLRSSASPGSAGAVFVPRQNIPTGEVTMQELLADTTRVPGSQGAYLRTQRGQPILFSDLSQLTINHNGAEFMLSREIVRNGCQVRRGWRIYSGTPDQIPAPRFLDPLAAGGGMCIERVVGHTHPRPIPYDPIYVQPSRADLIYLSMVASDWRQVYGPQSEPFGRIFWGLNPGETTIYGIVSTPGNAVPPRWLRRP